MFIAGAHGMEAAVQTTCTDAAFHTMDVDHLA
jgi:hypothetical protein